MLVYDSDLVDYPDHREDITVIPVPADSLARECGSSKVANIILLGVVVAASGIVSREAAKHVVEDKLGKKKPQFLPMNIKALEIGFSIADKFNK